MPIRGGFSVRNFEIERWRAKRVKSVLKSEQNVVLDRYYGPPACTVVHWHFGAQVS